MVVTSTSWCVILQGYWWEILVPYLLTFTIALMLICFHKLNKYGRYTCFIKINTPLPYPKRPDRHPLPEEIYTKTTTDKSFCYINSHVLPDKLHVSTVQSILIGTIRHWSKTIIFVHIPYRFFCLAKLYFTLNTSNV